MAQELVLGVDFDISKAEAKQKKLEERWNQAKRKTEEQRAAIQNIEAQLEKVKRHNVDYEAQLDEIDGKLQVIEQKYAEMSELERAQSGDELLAVKDKLLAKQKELLGLVTEGEVAEKRYTDQLQKANEHAGELETKLREAGYDLAANNAGIAKAAKDTAKAAKDTNGIAAAFEKVGKRVSGLVKRVFIFSVITKALRAIRSQISNIMLTDEKIAKQWSQLKGNLAAIGMTFYQTISPYIEWFLQKLVYITQIIAVGVSSLLGKSVDDMAALAANTTKAGAAAKKASAGFDTLQTAASGSESDAETGSADFSSIADLNADEYNKLLDKFNAIKNIAGLIGTILAAWKISSLLGHLFQASGIMGKFTGIIMAIAGAAILAFNWLDAWNNGIDWANLTGMLAGIALVVAGLALSFGSLGAAISMIIGGIALLVAGFKDWIKNGASMQSLAAISAGFLLIGGAIALLCGGWIPLLVAAIAAVVVAIVMYWDQIKMFFENLWKSIKAGISAAWEWFKNLPFVAWIIEHIIQPIKNGLFSALEWINKHIIQPVKDAIGTIVEAIALIAAKAMEIKNKILEIGKALLSALYTYVIKPLWDKFYNTIIKPIKDIASKVGSFIKEKFIDSIMEKVNWLKDRATEAAKSIIQTAVSFIGDTVKSVINGVLSGIENGINRFIALLNGAIGIINNIPGVEISEIAPIELPRLADGTVLPGGKPFAAIVGDQPAGQTNVEAPLDTIKQALAEVLAEINPSFTIEATGSMAQLIRLLRLEIKKEDRRATVW